MDRTGPRHGFLLPPEGGVASAVCRKKWVCVGDANGEPSESPIATTLRANGGRVVSDGTPTRWEGTRCIDWFVASRPRLLTWEGKLDVHLSDHIPLKAALNLSQGPVTTKGRLKPMPAWTRPAGLAVDAWRQILKTTWTQLQSTEDAQLLSQQLRSDEVQAQQEWDVFMALLGQVYKVATQQCSLHNDADVRASAARNLAQPGARSEHKGCLACHQEVTISSHRAGRASQCMSDIKESKRLARLHQLKRLWTHRADWTHSHLEEARRLATKVGLLDLLDLENSRQARQQLEVEVVHAKHRQVAREEAFKKQHLKDWRDKLNGSDKAISKWLKAKEDSQWCLGVVHEGRACSTTKDAAKAIGDHWRAVATDARWQDEAAAVARLAAGFRTRMPSFPPEDATVEDPPGSRWAGPSLEQYTAVCRQASGAHGTDGWGSEEWKQPLLWRDSCASAGTRYRHSLPKSSILGRSTSLKEPKSCTTNLMLPILGPSTLLPSFGGLG